MKLGKFYLLPLLLLLILGLSACGQKKGTENAPAGEENQVNQEESYFSSSIADMFKKGKALECYVKVDTEEATMESMYYFDNKNERVRVETKAVAKGQGMNFNSTSIIRDGWMYFWDDLMNKGGMKMELKEGEVDDAEEGETPVDMKENFDFKCKSWNVDASKFDLPSDKTFKDLTNMMNAITPSSGASSGGSTIDTCSYCDMLPEGDARTQCLNSCK